MFKKSRNLNLKQIIGGGGIFSLKTKIFKSRTWPLQKSRLLTNMFILLSSKDRDFYKKCIFIKIMYLPEINSNL